MSLYTLPELYDAQYQHYRDDLGFYTRLADNYGTPVLELGAGTGRVTSALARAGFRVVGLESQAPMLERARARLDTEGLGDLAQVIPGDMRTLELDQTFPLVIAPFNTLMHLYTLEDQDHTFAGILRHLTPGGMFAADLFRPKFGPLGVLRREAEWSRVGRRHTELFLCQHHDPDAQIISSDYYLDTVAPDGNLTRQTASLRQRYYTRFELERALRQAGFVTLQFSGGFDRAPLRPESNHLVVMARP